MGGREVSSERLERVSEMEENYSSAACVQSEKWPQCGVRGAQRRSSRPARAGSVPNRVSSF